MISFLLCFFSLLLFIIVGFDPIPFLSCCVPSPSYSMIPGRVTTDEIVRYTFQEGQLSPSSLLSYDRTYCGYNMLGPLLLNTDSSRWMNEESGVNLIGFGQQTRVQSSLNIAKLLTSLRGSHQLTMEMWITPASSTLNTPPSPISTSGPIIEIGGYRNSSSILRPCVDADSALSIVQKGTIISVYILASLISGGKSQCLQFSVDSDPYLTNSTTCQMTVVFSSSLYVKIYFNGELITYVSLSGTGIVFDFGNFNSSNILYMGQSSINATRTLSSSTWAGQIQLLSMYNRSLSDTEVLSNYNSGIQNNLPIVLPSISSSVNPFQFISNFQSTCYNSIPCILNQQYFAFDIDAISDLTSHPFLQNPFVQLLSLPIKGELYAFSTLLSLSMLPLNLSTSSLLFLSGGNPNSSSYFSSPSSSVSHFSSQCVFSSESLPPASFNCPLTYVYNTSDVGSGGINFDYFLVGANDSIGIGPSSFVNITMFVPPINGNSNVNTYDSTPTLIPMSSVNPVIPNQIVDSIVIHSLPKHGTLLSLDCSQTQCIGRAIVLNDTINITSSTLPTPSLSSLCPLENSFCVWYVSSSLTFPQFPLSDFFQFGSKIGPLSSLTDGIVSITNQNRLSSSSSLSVSGNTLALIANVNVTIPPADNLLCSNLIGHSQTENQFDFFISEIPNNAIHATCVPSPETFSFPMSILLFNITQIPSQGALYGYSVPSSSYSVSLQLLSEQYSLQPLVIGSLIINSSVFWTPYSLSSSDSLYSSSLLTFPNSVPFPFPLVSSISLSDSFSYDIVSITIPLSSGISFPSLCISSNLTLSVQPSTSQSSPSSSSVPLEDSLSDPYADLLCFNSSTTSSFVPFYNRFNSGLLVLYTFEEGMSDQTSSSTKDRSCMGLLGDLIIPDNGAWITDSSGISIPVESLSFPYSTKSIGDILTIIQSTNTLSVEFWIQKDVSGSLNIMSIYDPNNATDMVLSIDIISSTFEATTVMNSEKESSVFTYHQSTPLSHFVVMFSSSQIQIYENNEYIFSQSMVTSFDSWEDNYVVRVGGPSHEGSIYLLSMYSSVLTPNDIQLNYQSGLPLSPPQMRNSSQHLEVYQNVNSPIALDTSVITSYSNSNQIYITQIPSVGIMAVDGNAISDNDLPTLFPLTSTLSYVSPTSQYGSSLVSFSIRPYVIQGGRWGRVVSVPIDVIHVVTPPICVNQSLATFTFVPFLIQLNAIDDDTSSPLHSLPSITLITSLPSVGTLYQMDGTTNSSLGNPITHTPTVITDSQRRIFYISTDVSIFSAIDSFQFSVIIKNTKSQTDGFVTLNTQQILVPKAMQIITLNNSNPVDISSLFQTVPSFSSVYSSISDQMPIGLDVSSYLDNLSIAFQISSFPHWGNLTDINGNLYNISALHQYQYVEYYLHDSEMNPAPLYYKSNQNRYSGLKDPTLNPMPDTLEYSIAYHYTSETPETQWKINTFSPSPTPNISSSLALMSFQFAPIESLPFLVISNTSLAAYNIPNNVSVLANQHEGTSYFVNSIGSSSSPFSVLVGNPMNISLFIIQSTQAMPFSMECVMSISPLFSTVELNNSPLSLSIITGGTDRFSSLTSTSTFVDFYIYSLSDLNVILNQIFLLPLVSGEFTLTVTVTDNNNPQVTMSTDIHFVSSSPSTDNNNNNNGGGNTNNNPPLTQNPTSTNQSSSSILPFNLLYLWIGLGGIASVFLFFLCVRKFRKYKKMCTEIKTKKSEKKKRKENKKERENQKTRGEKMEAVDVAEKSNEQHVTDIYSLPKLRAQDKDQLHDIEKGMASEDRNLNHHPPFDEDQKSQSPSRTPSHPHVRLTSSHSQQIGTNPNPYPSTDLGNGADVDRSLTALIPSAQSHYMSSSQYNTTQSNNNTHSRNPSQSHEHRNGHVNDDNIDDGNFPLSSSIPMSLSHYQQQQPFRPNHNTVKVREKQVTNTINMTNSQPRRQMKSLSSLTQSQPLVSSRSTCTYADKERRVTGNSFHRSTPPGGLSNSHSQHGVNEDFQSNSNSPRPPYTHSDTDTRSHPRVKNDLTMPLSLSSTVRMSPKVPQIQKPMSNDRSDSHCYTQYSHDDDHGDGGKNEEKERKYDGNQHGRGDQNVQLSSSSSSLSPSRQHTKWNQKEGSDHISNRMTHEGCSW